MNLKTNLYLGCLFLFVLNSCTQSAKKQASEGELTSVPLKYAQSFDLQNGDDFKILKIYGIGRDSSNSETFKLVSAEKAKTRSKV